MQALESLMQNNKYLISEETDKIGEGTVWKNYDFVNRFGHHCYGKLVANEYLQHKYTARKVKVEVYERGNIEEKAINLLTDEMMIKEFERLKSEKSDFYENHTSKFTECCFKPYGMPISQKK